MTRPRDIKSLIPIKSSLIIVHDNTLDLERPFTLINYHMIPFLECNGKYWGKPADDAIAISELNRLKSQGAQWLVFAWVSFWWLEYYQDFYQYLCVHFPCVLKNERLIIFRLQEKC